MSTPDTNLKSANVALAKAWGIHVPSAVVANLPKPGFSKMDQEFMALMLKTVKAKYPVVVPTPVPTPTPVPASSQAPAWSGTGRIVTVVTKTIAAVAMAMDQAGVGETVHCPAGVYSGSGTFTVKAGVRLTGDGIYDPKTGTGTWLQVWLRWGNGSYVDHLLAGNETGYHCPVNGFGSDSAIFSLVRFKGRHILELGDNFDNVWSESWRGTISMTNNRFYDCEFERPLVSNAQCSGQDNVMDLWLDCRKGGAQVYDNRWYRCHFGVRNGTAGIDGYGIGYTVLFQPAPAEHGADGPRPSGKPDDVGFDWSVVDHGFHDHYFEDCLFEYALWYPMDICDYARSYSMTTRFGGVVGSNPPTGSQADQIPSVMWNERLAMTRCYHKGSVNDGGVVAEIGQDCAMTDCYCGSGSVLNQAGSFGNTASGKFPGGHPASPIFTSDWTGTGTSYTPSPFDPA